MSIIPITTAAHPLAAPFLQLPTQQPATNTCIIESEVCVERALDSGQRILRLLITPARWSRVGQAWTPMLGPAEVLLAPPPVLRDIVGFQLRRGCLAWADRPQPPVDPLTAWTRAAGFGVMLERLSDPANLGAVVRNAAAFAVPWIVCDPQGADPFSRRAIRASMGHVFSRQVLQTPLLETLQLFKQQKGRVFAATTDPTAQPIAQARPPSGVAVMLILGNEGHGLTPDLRALADLEVTVPMPGGVDSLNVAATTAVLFYEWLGRDPGLGETDFTLK